MDLNKYSFLLELILAGAKKDPGLIRQALDNLDKALMAVSDIIGLQVSNDKFVELKNHLLVIHQMIQGDNIRIDELVVKFIPDLDPAIAQTLHFASRKNIRCFEKILDSLELSVQKQEILELFTIIISGDSKLEMISK